MGFLSGEVQTHAYSQVEFLGGNNVVHFFESL